MKKSRVSKPIGLSLLVLLALPQLVRASGPLTPQEMAERSAYFAMRLGLNGGSEANQTVGISELQALAPSHASANWQMVGPNPVINESMLGPNGYCKPSPNTDASGRATAIAFGYGGAIYLGTAGGGVWKSTNGGTTWSQLTDNQPSLAVGAIAVVPGNATTFDEIYVGTGESNGSADSQYGQGVLKSTDGGQTWTQLGLNTLNYLAFSRLVVIAGQNSATDTLYAATTTASVGGRGGSSPPTATPGLYKSVDGGSTWTLLSGTGGLPAPSNGNGAATDVALLPGNSATVFAAISCTNRCYNGGVWRSQDAGATWKELPGVPNVTPRIALWIPSATQMYAAVAATNDNLDGVFVSTNGGNNWAGGGTLPQVGGAGCLSANQASYNLALGGDPAVPGTAYLGMIGLYRTTNGGATWSYSLDQSHPDFHAVAVNQGTIYALNDGGLSVSTNGTNWSQTINAGLATLQFTGAALGPQGNSLMFGGMQDNDLAISTGNVQWTSGNTGGDGGFTAIPPAGGVLFGETQGVNLLRSTVSQPGLNLSISPPVISKLEKTQFYAPFSLDPSNGDRILYGTHRIWQSCANGVCNATTGGATDGSSPTPVNWTAISPALNPGCVSSGESGPVQRCLVTDVRVARTNSAVLYAVTASYGSTGPFAWVSTNSTSTSPTFTNISAGLPGGEPLQSVAISPINPSVAAVAVGGFTSGGGHIFETTNGGSAWTDISTVASGFPNLPVTKVLFDANDTSGQTLIAATAAGLLRTTNNGQSWQNFTLNMPLVQVYSMDQNPNYLLAATHGRSVWVMTTAVPGGAITATPVTSSGVAGQSVAGGGIQVSNSSASAGSLLAVTIGVSNPSLFASMVLSGGGGSAQTSAISTATTFHFSPPLTIAAGQSINLSLSAVLAAAPVIPAAGTIVGQSNGAPWSGPTGRTELALLLTGASIGLLLLMLPGYRRWLPVAAAMVLLALVVAQSGCSSSSSSPAPTATPTATATLGPSPTPTPIPIGTSSQTVTQVWIATGGQSLQVSGLPGNLGTVALNP